MGTAQERRTPSRRKPARSATRCDAGLSGRTWISSRARPSSSRAQRESNRTARLATPRPRAGAATR